jgi:hypothetical protein
MPVKVSMWCVICPRSEACFGTRLELLDPKWSGVCGVSKTCLGVFFLIFFVAAGLTSKPAVVACWRHQ